MKTIGMIGGMSWESSLEFYRIINETVKDRLGGLHSAKSIMYSIDFEEVEVLQREDKWDEAALIMIDAAQRVERGGADFIILCTNTMHKLVNEIQASVKIPILHIADATAAAIKARGINKVGLLGTKYTIEGDFYSSRLQDSFGIEIVMPTEQECQVVHDVIYNELCVGKINDPSRAKFIDIINNLIEQGAEGIILGCTEIPLLVKTEDIDVPLFDTTRIHAEAAVDYALRQ